MIQAKYESACRHPCDINEHLPTLFKYASECNHVTECGVRSVVSSWAFAKALEGKPQKKLVQVDIKIMKPVADFINIVNRAGIPTVFHEMSDLECPLEETDMLFIDTWHVYGHLKRELERWHGYTRKYIIMHDTTLDGEKGESIRMNWDTATQSKESGYPIDEIRKGLWPAVQEFLDAHPDWVLHERFYNNNGLTVLKRV